jgi:hypothetical protein
MQTQLDSAPSCNGTIMPLLPTTNTTGCASRPLHAFAWQGRIINLRQHSCFMHMELESIAFLASLDSGIQGSAGQSRSLCGQPMQVAMRVPPPRKARVSPLKYYSFASGAMHVRGKHGGARCLRTMLKDAATMAFASAAHRQLRALQASVKFKFQGLGLQ